MTSASYRKLNILVIDDEPFILEYVGKVLRQIGYGTFFAEDGDKALAYFEERRAEVDLVLSDIVMPESIDGLELADRIRRIDPAVPVLFITGAIPDEDAQIRSLNERGFLLRKPFFPDQLIRFVENHVQHFGLAV